MHLRTAQESNVVESTVRTENHIIPLSLMMKVTLALALIFALFFSTVDATGTSPSVAFSGADEDADGFLTAAELVCECSHHIPHQIPKIIVDELFLASYYASVMMC